MVISNEKLFGLSYCESPWDRSGICGKTWSKLLLFKNRGFQKFSSSALVFRCRIVDEEQVEGLYFHGNLQQNGLA